MLRNGYTLVSVLVVFACAHSEAEFAWGGLVFIKKAGF